jgi:hypothetical protein
MSTQHSDHPNGLAAALPDPGSLGAAILVPVLEIPSAFAALRERPALVWAWLRYAWRTQLALAIALPALYFVAPPLVDAVVERGQTTDDAWPRKLIGAVTGERHRRDAERLEMLRATWRISLAGIVLLFVYELPGAIARGGARRRPGEPIRPGQRVGGRYRLLEALGSGGVGTVHVAEDLVLHRRVALKELHLNVPAGTEQGTNAAARFREEAQALARVSHPNVVQVFDLVEEDGRYWIAMELVEGGDLEALVRREGPLPWQRALDFVVSLADALDTLHALGIVHRDVKPLNVLLAPDGTPKLADFGLAKSEQSSVQTHADVLMGSPAYLSPEQIQGAEAGPASDVYALGVLLYQLLTGQLPFEGEPANVLVQHAVAEPPAPSRSAPGSIPEAIDDLVLSMLEKRPDDRPVPAGEIAKRCRDAGWRSADASS